MCASSAISNDLMSQHANTGSGNFTSTLYRKMLRFSSMCRFLCDVKKYLVENHKRYKLHQHAYGYQRCTKFGNTMQK
uniref:Uncharacterized protein n=1 Tax=Romanomermis culicivorax TaxID=13658 RepID=A0A915HJI4_ROMCU